METQFYTVRMVRTARVEEAHVLARLINDAFIVEAFFKIGDRTSAEEIRDLMHAGGEFLVLDGARAFIACAYLKVAGERSYFGMLSIDPTRQRERLGRRMIEAVEAR